MEKVKTELKGVLIENSLQNVQGRNKQKEKRVTKEYINPRCADKWEFLNCLIKRSKIAPKSVATQFIATVRLRVRGANSFGKTP